MVKDIKTSFSYVENGYKCFNIKEAVKVLKHKHKKFKKGEINP